jgi:hypothetical protein
MRAGMGFGRQGRQPGQSVAKKQQNKGYPLFVRSFGYFIVGHSHHLVYFRVVCGENWRPILERRAMLADTFFWRLSLRGKS